MSCRPFKFCNCHICQVGRVTETFPHSSSQTLLYKHRGDTDFKHKFSHFGVSFHQEDNMSDSEDKKKKHESASDDSGSESDGSGGGKGKKKDKGKGKDKNKGKDKGSSEKGKGHKKGGKS
ncbi:hypothetical protein AMECASPLE_000333 [Ameca splendens]|uniref:Uncharacterized protein n=1 Tax=Ameca splendens TaxID=208324 RepID=A0ABV0ZTM5_9TELE